MMFLLIRWLIRKLRRPAAPAILPAETPAAPPGQHQPAAPTSTGGFATAQRTPASRADSRGPALFAHGLSKRFGDRVAFSDVSCEIGYGEVFGFLGPNGAGKTTTVRTLSTLIAPTSGSATVAGISLTPENGVQIRRRNAVTPESPGLYLRLSVAENLRCFADLYEVPGAGGRIARALRAVNPADRAHDACGPNASSRIPQP
jgi:ABC-type multidrug transport system fused ATPase/permease subunit